MKHISMKMQENLCSGTEIAKKIIPIESPSGQMIFQSLIITGVGSVFYVRTRFYVIKMFRSLANAQSLYDQTSELLK